MDEEDVRQIQENIEEMYSNRINEKGLTPQGLFWDSKESMEKRFHAAVEMYNFKNKKVLDIGCGLGHFYEFLCDIDQKPDQYYGIDINEKVLEKAREDHPECSFEKRNILLSEFDEEQFDIAVIFGTVFNNLDRVSNEEYLREFMRKSFSCSDNVLINLLSDYRQGEWDYEEFVYYYSPEKVFGYAQEFTRNVVIKHDFEPNPQKEFNVLLKPPEEFS